eukprot:XP_001706015.1 Hypothetical protein GL50803_96601 [Giardia lamblia ATCC 50803]
MVHESLVCSVRPFSEGGGAYQTQIVLCVTSPGLINIGIKHRSNYLTNKCIKCTGRCVHRKRQGRKKPTVRRISLCSNHFLISPLVYKLPR